METARRGTLLCPSVVGVEVTEDEAGTVRAPNKPPAPFFAVMEVSRGSRAEGDELMPVVAVLLFV